MIPAIDLQQEILGLKYPSPPHFFAYIYASRTLHGECYYGNSLGCSKHSSSDYFTLIFDPNLFLFKPGYTTVFTAHRGGKGRELGHQVLPSIKGSVIFPDISLKVHSSY